ncbi:MAG TPA: glucosamine-6-phosphate deaminase [Verrucomicrobiae bacterium]|nr:glucosamine-6-phosphate deaminase [Verrucomicrobiae bacterium]
MKTRIFSSRATLDSAAGTAAREALAALLATREAARIVVATGASQLSFLKTLTGFPDIDWKRVEMFHLDEYVGLPMTHPASFRKYLLERFIQPAGIKQYHLLDGEGEAQSVCQKVGAELSKAPIDVAFVGIGENGHLAFNDPPANFETEQPYLVVELDEACRRQQVGEGWFKDLSEVPKQAISMSIRQIMKAQKILCIVPDQRKAQAVKDCLEGPVSPLAPASILQTHPDVTVFLDTASASLLAKQSSVVHAD